MDQLTSFLEAAGKLLEAVGGQFLAFLQNQGETLLTVFLAVVAALCVNHRIQRRRQRLVARRMRQTIVWEAEANKSILNESFRKFLDHQNAPTSSEAAPEDTDAREFDTSTSGPHVQHPVFLEHIPEGELKTIATYVRAVRVANDQRRKLEALRASAAESSPTQPGKDLEAALVSHLLDCEESIDAVVRLRGKQKD